VELCGADIPVHLGAAKPLIRQLESATWFHGMDGLGDCGFRVSHRTVDPLTVVEAIVANALANPGLELITLGPLTNFALAIRQQPTIVRNISRCVVMGGAACTEGNVTPAAEFNIWVDPEAAREVFLSGLPIEMVGWELSRHDVALDEHDIAAVQGLDTPLARFVIGCNGRARETYLEQTVNAASPDPIPMAVMLEPELVLESSEHYVEIETRSALTRGMTVVDRLNVSGDARNEGAWSEVRSREEGESGLETGC
jgi:purine nucleosidase